MPAGCESLRGCGASTERSAHRRKAISAAPRRRRPTPGNVLLIQLNSADDRSWWLIRFTGGAKSQSTSQTNSKITCPQAQRKESKEQTHKHKADRRVKKEGKKKFRSTAALPLPPSSFFMGRNKEQLITRLFWGMPVETLLSLSFMEKNEKAFVVVTSSR